MSKPPAWVEETLQHAVVMCFFLGGVQHSCYRVIYSEVAAGLPRTATRAGGTSEALTPGGGRGGQEPLRVSMFVGNGQLWVPDYAQTPWPLGPD